MNSQRVRIRFHKEGDLRQISHRDLVRALQRLFRRAGLKLAVSQGFHPKPKMMFPSALGLGMGSLDELVELELAEPATAEPLQAKLAQHAIPGLVFKQVELLPPGTPKARPCSATYEVPVPPERQAAAQAAVERLCSLASVPVHRPRRGKTLDVKTDLEDLRLEQGRLRMRLRIHNEGAIQPREVLAALELADLELHGCTLTRTAMELAS